MRILNFSKTPEKKIAEKTQISHSLESILVGSRNVDNESSSLAEVIEEAHSYFRELKKLSKENSSLFQQTAES